MKKLTYTIWLRYYELTGKKKIKNTKIRILAIKSVLQLNLNKLEKTNLLIFSKNNKFLKLFLN